jgi:hypothetical protein
MYLVTPTWWSGVGVAQTKKNQYKPGKKAKQKNINISFTGSPIF